MVYEPMDMDYTLNCNGQLLCLDRPRVMGILNATPDSFYAQSRVETEQQVAQRTAEMLAEGADIIDVGACSTRPGSQTADEAEEMRRLRMALAVVRHEAPTAVLSVDTFRPNVARMAVEEFGVDMVNDVGEGAADTANGQEGLSPAAPGRMEMWRMVSRLRVPYIYMSRASRMHDILLDCAEAVNMLHSMGQKDIVVDPGIGFGKTMEQGYEVMQQLERMQMLRLPILVGVSRKSLLGNASSSQRLTGTTVLNTVALLKGASILRVHDVAEAVECCRIAGQLKANAAACSAQVRESVYQKR